VPRARDAARRIRVTAHPKVVRHHLLPVAWRFSPAASAASASELSSSVAISGDRRRHRSRGVRRSAASGDVPMGMPTRRSRRGLPRLAHRGCVQAFVGHGYPWRSTEAP